MIEATPLLTNDAAGFARLIIGLILGNAPVYGLVVYFMRKGPDARIDAMENKITTIIDRDVAGIGRKADETDRAQELLRGEHIDLRRAMDLSIADRDRIKIDLGRLEGRMDGYEKQTIEMQRDIMTAITSSAKALTETMQQLAIRVERMETKTDVVREICKSFDELGDKIVGSLRR